jgi:outer membrane biosynthesis protein TonB
VPDRRSIFRLLALTGFLLTVALALWLTELQPLLVGAVMTVALALAWAVEWLSRRQELPRLDAEGSPEVEAGDGAEAAARRPESDVPPPEGPAPLEPPVPPALAVPPAEPEQHAEPELEREPEPPPAAPEPEPPPRPPLRPVPPPPPDPLPPAPTPPERAPAAAQPPPAGSGVVDMRTRATAAPRRWNLWDLERRARDEQRRDPDKYQQWSYLFVHLRQFASPDGSLPTEFDGLVRESFGDLLEHAG